MKPVPVGTVVGVPYTAVTKQRDCPPLADPCCARGEVARVIEGGCSGCVVNIGEPFWNPSTFEWDDLVEWTQE